MKYVNLGKSFNNFKKQFLMNDVREELAYYRGKIDCLNDLMKYIKNKTNLKTDVISAISLMEDFVQTKTDLNEKELNRLSLLIPKQN